VEIYEILFVFLFSRQHKIYLMLNYILLWNFSYCICNSVRIFLVQWCWNDL